MQLGIYLLVLGSGCLILFALGLAKASKDDYECLRSELDIKFDQDLDYCLDLVKELNYREGDRRIDEFEEKWVSYIPKDKLIRAIGKLVEAQCIGLGV
jgi:hypothetical protein